MKKKFKFFLIISVCVSFLCGIVASVFYIQYHIRYEDVFTSCANDMSCVLESSNFNPILWVIISISFVVGFFVPLIAYVLNKVSEATVEKVEDALDL